MYRNLNFPSMFEYSYNVYADELGKWFEDCGVFARTEDKAKELLSKAIFDKLGVASCALDFVGLDVDDVECDEDEDVTECVFGTIYVEDMVKKYHYKLYKMYNAEGLCREFDVYATNEDDALKYAYDHIGYSGKMPQKAYFTEYFDDELDFVCVVRDTDKEGVEE